MFDINILEIFNSVGVGIAAFLLIAYFCFLIPKLFIADRYNQYDFIKWFKTVMRRDYSKSGYAIIVTVAIYCLGLIIQDFTDFMSDSDSSKNPLVKLFQKSHLLKSETEIRKSVLIDDDNSFTGLGNEILTNPALYANRSVYTNLDELPKDQLENCKNFHDCQNVCDSVNNFINSIYYNAKNWCYLYSPTAHKELAFIQSRIDFSRSIFILSLASFLCLIIVFIIYYLKELIKGKKSFLIQQNSLKSKKVYYPRLSLIVLIPMILVSRECFIAEEINFDERAFGYYRSHISFPADLIQKANPAN